MNIDFWDMLKPVHLDGLLINVKYGKYAYPMSSSNHSIPYHKFWVDGEYESAYSFGITPIPSFGGAVMVHSVRLNKKQLTASSVAQLVNALDKLLESAEVSLAMLALPDD